MSIGQKITQNPTKSLQNQSLKSIYRNRFTEPVLVPTDLLFHVQLHIERDVADVACDPNTGR